jgi:uncharacterized protein (TIGR03437 family)
VNSSGANPVISGAANAASFQNTYAPGMILSIFGTQLALTTRSVGSAPLPTTLDNVSVTVNGIAAPLYYISPAQLNVQIPYETTSNGTATVTVRNNGQTALSQIRMSATAPGIFTDTSGGILPAATAARGQTMSLYLTGAGALQPSIATGAVPAGSATSSPTATTSVTVGGIQASTTYIGVPSWAIGVLQINLTVPVSVPAGQQSVVVTVGGASSPAAELTVQ